MTLRLSHQQRRVLAHLRCWHAKDPGAWQSPTGIGCDMGHADRNSSWASPKCLRLVAMGLLERNSRGCYRVTKKGLEFDLATEVKAAKL